MTPASDPIVHIEKLWSVFHSAGRAAVMLRQAGYANVHVLGGGLRAWREANLPVDKSA